MQKRLLVALGLCAALAFLGLLIALLLQDPPKVKHEEAVAPAGISQFKSEKPPDRRQQGELKGLVVHGLTGAPIEGASILALAPHLKASPGEVARWGDLLEKRRMRSGPDGRFKFDLPRDYWNLWVEKEGFGFQTVPRAQFEKNHTIKLYPGCAVFGRVVHPDETPAEGIRIEYTPQHTNSEVFGFFRAPYYKISTDKEGKFRFDDLPPGKFTIEVYSDEHIPAPWLFEKPLKPGEQRDLKTKVLNAGFGLKIRVLWLGSEEPVAGVKVHAWPIGDPMPRTKTGRTAFTDEKGWALFQGLGGQKIPDPTFSVTALDFNGELIHPAGPSGPLTVRPGESHTIFLRKRGILIGKVERPGGEPLHWFTASLEPLGHDRHAPRVKGENGTFKIPSVPEGKYRLRIRHEDFADATKEVDVVAGTDTDAGLVIVGSGAEIEGVVRNASGRPLDPKKRYRVILATWNQSRNTHEMVKTTWADREGNYRIRGVNEGRFFLLTDTKFNTTPWSPVDVPRRGKVRKDLLVYGAGNLDLVFEDEVDGRLRKVVPPPVRLLAPEATEPITWMGKGHDLRPGKYTVLVQFRDGKDARWVEVGQFTVQEGQTADPIKVRLDELRDR